MRYQNKLVHIVNDILCFLKYRKAELIVFIFVFTLSFDPDFSSKGLILMIITLFFCFKARNLFFDKKYLSILVLTIIYLTLNMSFLAKEIDLSNYTLPLLCILFFLLIFQMREAFNDLKKITIFFTLGVLIVGAINLFVFFIKSNNYKLFDSWTKYSIFDIHKIYYGAFVNIAMLMLFYLKTKKDIKVKILFFFIPLFLIYLFYTGSVSNLFIFILINCLYLFHKYFMLFYKGLYLFFLIIPLFIMISLSMPFGKQIFTEIEGEKSRIRNFETNKNIIVKAPIFGYGIGKELWVMQNARNEKSWEYLNKYNAHNQYFQYIIGGGIIYLLLSILPVVYINIKDKKLNQNLLVNGFTLILSYIFLIESFEERHHGQFFYAFFLNLIFYEISKDKL